jgi:hypothetical protein
MSMLSIVQAFCARNHIPVPATVMGSTDAQVIGLRALLEEEGDDLSARHSWQGITFEATHTSLATEDQGAMSTLASNGFNYIVNGTIWDRSQQLRILGPLDAQEWQAAKAMVPTGPDYRFRIRGDRLLITPTPSAGNSWAFEYVSSNWILGADGVTYKNRFTLDTDTLLLPENLLTAGLKWRWRKDTGLEYAEDFRTYEAQIKDAMGRDGGKKTLDMNGCKGDAMPGVFVPQGSWAVP